MKRPRIFMQEMTAMAFDSFYQRKLAKASFKKEVEQEINSELIK